MTLEQAIQLEDDGKFEEAETAYRELQRERPENASIDFRFGSMLARIGRIDEGLKLLKRAVRRAPHDLEARLRLANVLAGTGQLPEASLQLEIALEQNGQSFEAWHAFAIVKQRMRDFAGSLKAFERAIALKPEDASVHTNFGNALSVDGYLDRAIAAHERAVSLKPDFAEARNNLAHCYLLRSMSVEAIDVYRRLVQDFPERDQWHSNLIAALHYDPQRSDEMISREAVAWGQRFPSVPRPRLRNRHNRLRIAYVSPDFRHHPVGWLMEAVLTHHDRRHFEVICYSDSMFGVDDQSAKLRALAEHWRSTHKMSDRQLAATIQTDEVDVLVDLSGHFAGNRLPLFALRPAPIQATFLNFPGTTGLPAMDFRLTDVISDPASADAFHTERLVRCLPTPWTYVAPQGIDRQLFLGRRSGQIVFCNLNNPSKTNHRCVECWSRILKAVPRSALMLLTHAREENSYLSQMFAKQGIEASRLIWVNPRGRADYLRLYQFVDVALDPFPFNGGLTTCDALWMGAPVVTLIGRGCSSRRGAALASAIGRQDLICTDEEHYVDRAVALAKDGNHLQQRQQLRDFVDASPLLDHARFAKTLEDGVATLLEKWRK